MDKSLIQTLNFKRNTNSFVAVVIRVNQVYLHKNSIRLVNKNIHIYLYTFLRSLLRTFIFNAKIKFFKEKKDKSK